MPAPIVPAPTTPTRLILALEPVGSFSGSLRAWARAKKRLTRVREAVPGWLAPPLGALGESSETFRPGFWLADPEIGDPPMRRLSGVDPVPAEDDPQSSLQANDARQPLRTAPRRQQSQLDLRKSE